MGTREIHPCRGCPSGRALDGMEFCSEGCEQRWNRNVKRIARVLLPMPAFLYCVGRLAQEVYTGTSKPVLCHEVARAAVAYRYTGSLMPVEEVPELGVHTIVKATAYQGRTPYLTFPVAWLENEEDEIIYVRVDLPDRCEVYPPVSMAFCREHGSSFHAFGGDEDTWSVDASLIATEYVEKWP